MSGAGVSTGVEAVPYGKASIPVFSTFLAVAWAAILLRLYTRIFIVRVLYAEDWFTVVTGIFYSVYCGSVIACAKIVTLGAGKQVPLEPLEQAIALLMTADLFYGLTLLVLKLSVGLFFLRLAAQRWKRIFIWTMLGLLFVSELAVFFFTIFHCGYFSSMTGYLENVIIGKCTSPQSVLIITYLHSAIAMLTDFVFALMPVLVLKPLELTRREKWVVGSLMAFASVSGIASIARFPYISGLTTSAATTFTGSITIGIWSCTEVGIGVIAASLVCLRPLWRRVVPHQYYTYYTVNSNNTRPSFQFRISLSAMSEQKLSFMDLTIAQFGEQPKTVEITVPPPTASHWSTSQPNEMDVEIGLWTVSEKSIASSHLS